MPDGNQKKSYKMRYITLLLNVAILSVKLNSANGSANHIWKKTLLTYTYSYKLHILKFDLKFISITNENNFNNVLKLFDYTHLNIF